MNWSALRAGALALALPAVLLFCAAPAFADPGAPGLDRASTAVYANTSTPPTLGGEQVPTDGAAPGAVVGEVVDERGDLPGGDDGLRAVRAEVSDDSDDGGSGSLASLPFTGLSAALVMAAGLAALLLGLAAHAAARRTRRR